MLLLPRHFARGALLTLHQLGHAVGQIVAGHVGRDPLRFLPRRTRTVTAIGLSVVGDADSHSILGVAESGPCHHGDEYDDEGDAGDNRPFPFGLRHSFYAPTKKFPIWRNLS